MLYISSSFASLCFRIPDIIVPPGSIVKQADKRVALPYKVRYIS